VTGIASDTMSSREDGGTRRSNDGPPPTPICHDAGYLPGFRAVSVVRAG